MASQPTSQVSLICKLSLIVTGLNFKAYFAQPDLRGSARKKKEEMLLELHLLAEATKRNPGCFNVELRLKPE